MKWDRVKGWQPSGYLLWQPEQVSWIQLMTLLHPPCSTQERPAQGSSQWATSVPAVLSWSVFSPTSTSHTHTHTPLQCPHCDTSSQGSFVFTPLVSFALVCYGVNRVQGLGDKFCLTKQTTGELFGNACEAKGQGRAICKQRYRAVLTKGASATSLAQHLRTNVLTFMKSSEEVTAATSTSLRR